MTLTARDYARILGMPECYPAKEEKLMETPVRALDRETQAAMAIKEALGAFEDADLIADMIEGETNLNTAILAVVALMDETEILISGVKARIDELTGRKQRFERRSKALRSIVEQAMTIGECKPIEAPDYTVSLAKKPRAIEVIEESEIPAAYWLPSDPKLDRSALARDLRDGVAIPGARLDNGGVTLKVRRK